MITIQKIRNADCDGGGYSYVVCEDNDIKQAYEYFDNLKDAEKKLKELEE